mgnify:CR=1 FL=1
MQCQSHPDLGRPSIETRVVLDSAEGLIQFFHDTNTDICCDLCLFPHSAAFKDKALEKKFAHIKKLFAYNTPL